MTAIELAEKDLESALELLKAKEVDEKTLLQIAVDGNIMGLSNAQKCQYYVAQCLKININPSKKPFDLIPNYRKNKKGDREMASLTLYANSLCAQELRAMHEVSISPPKTLDIGDEFITVTIVVSLPDGRTDFGMGIVETPKYNRGDAVMKAITKAKRRGTFSILGLPYLDDPIKPSPPKPEPEPEPVEVEVIDFLSYNDLMKLGEVAELNGWKQGEITEYLDCKYPGIPRDSIPASDYTELLDAFQGGAGA